MASRGKKARVRKRRRARALRRPPVDTGALLDMGPLGACFEGVLTYFDEALFDSIVGRPSVPAEVIQPMRRLQLRVSHENLDYRSPRSENHWLLAELQRAGFDLDQPFTRWCDHERRETVFQQDLPERTYGPSPLREAWRAHRAGRDRLDALQQQYLLGLPISQEELRELYESTFVGPPPERPVVIPEDAEVSKIKGHYQSFREQFTRLGLSEEELVAAFRLMRMAHPELTAEQYLRHEQPLNCRCGLAPPIVEEPLLLDQLRRQLTDGEALADGLRRKQVRFDGEGKIVG